MNPFLRGEELRPLLLLSPSPMSISGHKTRSVFDRYDIVDEDDVIAAGNAIKSYLEESMGTKRAQILEFPSSEDVSVAAK